MRYDRERDCKCAERRADPADRRIWRLHLLPEAVSAGRRIARNIHRLGRLYMTKTVYAAALIVLVAIPGFAFPFLPRHLTLAALLTIGIPSFVLALAPSDGPLYRGRLLRALAAFAVPAGLAEFGSVLVVTRNCCSWLWAVASDSPVTGGILIFFGPVETSSVTVLPGATLTPNCGFVWVTTPALTDDEGTMTTFDFSPAS